MTLALVLLIVEVLAPAVRQWLARWRDIAHPWARRRSGDVGVPPKGR